MSYYRSQYVQAEPHSRQGSGTLKNRFPYNKSPEKNSRYAKALVVSKQTVFMELLDNPSKFGYFNSEHSWVDSIPNDC